MTKEMKLALEVKLDFALTQLKQAQKALRKKEFAHSSIYVGNVQGQMPELRQQLARG